MKKTVRKLLAGLISMTLILSVFSGCGGNGGETAENVDTITFWSPSPHSKALYVRLVNDFNETIGKKKGIKIVYEIKESNIAQAIELALAADQAPDLFVGGNVEELASKGQIMAFEDIEGGEALVDKYRDRLVPYTNTYNGKTYTLPVNATTRGLIYNKQMFIDAGLVDSEGNPTPPETWDEFREYAKKLTNTKEKKFGVVLPLKWTGWADSDILAMGMQSCGHQAYNPSEGKFDYSIYEPVINAYLGIKEDGSMVPGAESIDNDVARARFAEGNIGMKISASYDVAVLNDQFPAKIDWGIAPLPVVDKSNKYKQVMSLGSSARINAKTLERVGAEKLITVLEWFYGDEVLSETFKEGINIPNDVNIIKNTDLSGARKGWKEYADLIEISTFAPTEIKTDTTGLTSFSDMFLNDIYSGKKSVSQALEDYSNDMNARIETYIGNNPNYDPSPFIIEDWKGAER